MTPSTSLPIRGLSTSAIEAIGPLLQVPLALMDGRIGGSYAYISSYLFWKGGKCVRRLPPTLAPWPCAQQWKTTTSRPGQGDIVRIRALTCRRWGLQGKTEARLAVPWDQGDFMTLAAPAVPEDVVVDGATRRMQGLRGEGLSQLNTHLIPLGWQLALVRDQGRIVGVVRQRMSPDARGDTNGVLAKRRERRHSDGGC